ncbi:uncharacterized protein LOC141908708 [Tubulanus polymorphus]|uniref:uncharacterized protein LOC141908708 n=1 Tax=Tubulanus polymorphus TaxID=672921 RepID=UPI003DA56AA5
MGVRGLMSYVLQNRHKTVEFIDLVEKSRENHGIEILVDYYAFQHHIVDLFWKSLTAATGGNAYLRFAGGEYEILHHFVTKLVEDLRRIGVHPVFYVDAGKGVNRRQTDLKLDTWRSRHRDDLDKLGTILNVCSGSTDVLTLAAHVNIRPVCLEIQIFESLLRLRVEMVHCIAEEADSILARDLTRRPKAFAVLSNDSDFFLFRDSVFIPLKLFDLENDLQLGERTIYSEKPTRLLAGVIRVTAVQRLLGFRDHEQLIEFAIVAGNDFTKPVLTSSVRDKLGLRTNASFGELAGWIVRHRALENHHLMHSELLENERLKLAIDHSRDFYSLKSTQSTTEYRSLKAGHLTDYLVECVSNGSLPSNVLAMHNNFYWHRMLIEDMSIGHPCIESVLSDLRSFIYRIVLPVDENVVIEYGRTPQEQMQTTEIEAAQCLPDGATIRTADYIQPDRVWQNLKMLQQILTHQESPGFKGDYFNRFGRWNGFICYLLRYFLKLNWGRYLCLSEDEFVTLVACLFHSESGVVDLNLYQSIEVKPDVRCVTISNWFQALYRYAYAFLAKLLYLEHEFPKPKDLFAGSVWTVFIMCSKNKFNYSENLNILNEDLQQVILDHRNIVRDKRKIIQCLVEDIFYLNYRF